MANGIVKRHIEMTKELSKRPIAENNVHTIVGYDEKSDERVHDTMAYEYAIEHCFVALEPVNEQDDGDV